MIRNYDTTSVQPDLIVMPKEWKDSKVSYMKYMPFIFNYTHDVYAIQVKLYRNYNAL